MSDIFGRSTIAPTNVITKKQISSMIRKYITSGLNLVNVDPGEIVVFGDKTGKLKTSDISLDSLLTIPEGVTDDSIAVFKQNKITAGDKLSSITSSVTQLRNEYNAHVVNFATLRRNFNTADNAIEKFLGKKNIKPDEITTTLADINTAQQKFTNDITALNSRLGVIRDTKSISDLIAINKKSIEDIKKVTDKVKTSHDTSKIKSLSYVVHQEFDVDYLPENLGGVIVKIMQRMWYESVLGIYRISVFSEHQFNIEVTILNKDNSKTTSKGVNTTLIALREAPDPQSLAGRLLSVGNFSISVKPVDPNVVRTKFSYIVEYVSPI